MAAQHRTSIFQQRFRNPILILWALCLLILVAASIQPVVADSTPTLQFSTYLGGDSTDFGQDVTTDQDGNIYIAGTTLSSDFPVTTSLDAASNKLFVSKFDPTGTTLLYSMVIGTGFAEAIVVDDDGYAYVVGDGTHLPTVNAIQSTYGGGNEDAFIVKLNPSGTALEFSTYLGGSGDDSALGVGIDSARNVYVMGVTTSTNFPTQSAYQNTSGGGQDTFMVKIDASGSTLVYSTYYGGSQSDVGEDMVADSDGNVYMAGRSASSNFPLVSAFQTAPGGACTPPLGCGHAFVAKLNPSGVPIFSTLLGGNAQSSALGIAIDNQHNVYVGGYTQATNFPTKNAYQATPPSETSAFVTKFNPGGSQLVYSTYLAGTTGDSPNGGSGIGTGIAVDSVGRATIVGQTVATDFPIVHPIQAQRAGTAHNVDPFISTFNPDGRSLQFSTYWGGSDSEDYPDRMPRVTVDQSDSILIVGSTRSVDFPVVNAFQSQDSVFYEAFITKIALLPASEPMQAAGRNYFTTDTPTLTWTPVIWATHYHVQVSKNKLFTGTPAFDDMTAANVFSITTTPLDDGLYYWHVQAQKADGSWGGWSPVESFTVYAN